MDQISIFSLMYETYKVRKPVRLIETFAGYGSQAMALKRLGIPMEHYRMVEIDEYAVKSYNAVHGTDFQPMDITKIHGEDLGVVDKDKYEYIMTYSFPCTDISLAGEQKGFKEGSGTRSALLWEVQRILDELKAADSLPQILLMENVTAIHQEGENLKHFRKWIDYLEDIGYSNFIQDLNAVDYGVAQNRDRTFVLSILGKYNYDFPVPIPLNKCIEDYFEELSDEEALNYIVKSDKAKDLLVELDGKNELN